jgi:hypothetical protein
MMTSISLKNYNKKKKKKKKKRVYSLQSSLRTQNLQLHATLLRPR